MTTVPLAIPLIEDDLRVCRRASEEGVVTVIMLGFTVLLRANQASQAVP